MEKLNPELEEDLVSFERCTNIEEIKIIKNQISCPICLNILISPKKCSGCNNVFCKKCIYIWEQKKKECPFKCKNFKLLDTDITFNRFLFLVQMKCKYLKCEFSGGYNSIIDHEKNCEFREISCLNYGCNNMMKQTDLVDHISNKCEFTQIKCPSCLIYVVKSIFSEHFKQCSKHAKICCNCKVILSNLMSVCICLKKYCINCFENSKNLECAKTCFLWDNNSAKTSNFFNISLKPLIMSFSVKIKINAFTVLRVGVTLDKDILEDNDKPGIGNTDPNSKELYFLSLNGLRYYTKQYDWFDIENTADFKGGFKKSDILTIESNGQFITFYKNDLKIKPSLEVKNFRYHNTPLYIVSHSKAPTAESAKNKNQLEIISIQYV